jgi:hypothetical protein
MRSPSTEVQSSLLPQLKHRFQCYAIIRNPLGVMASRSHMGKVVHHCIGLSPIGC